MKEIAGSGVGVQIGKTGGVFFRLCPELIGGVIRQVCYIGKCVVGPLESIDGCGCMQLIKGDGGVGGQCLGSDVAAQQNAEDRQQNGNNADDDVLRKRQTMSRCSTYIASIVMVSFP